jgi:hypothetical protein
MPRKKKEDSKPKKIYPSLVLGLDISTACIGCSIVYDDGVNMPIIKTISHVVPKIPSKKKGIEALILRKEIFEHDFLSKIKDVGITECVIESPLVYATGNSNAQTVSQLLQFNGLLSEAVYRVLGIVPNYVSSFDARQQSYPSLLSIRKFNKKGEVYAIKHIIKDLKDNHLVLFGAYPFDCDKKNIMMDMVNEQYPDIDWILDANGEIKKENYDANDSLICALAYINTKRNGQLDAKVIDYNITKNSDNDTVISDKVCVWGNIYEKIMMIPKIQLKG